MSKKKINEILPPDLWEGENFLDIPAWAFIPDVWSFAFLRGLKSIANTFAGLDIWEVGVGTGLNQICLARWCQADKLFFSDYGYRCTELTVRNLAQIADQRFIPLFGKWDLISREDKNEAPPKVDVIVACIPQIPTTLNLDEKDNLAHYYDPMRYEASLHSFGLGLNEALLQRAHNILNPQGRVILNLGGRPGLPLLKKMFRDCRYIPRVIYSEIIPQCPSTSLASLVAIETSGPQEFEFFTDRLGHQRINAQSAEKRRLEGLELYHKIYVIEGKSQP